MRWEFFANESVLLYTKVHYLTLAPLVFLQNMTPDFMALLGHLAFNS